MAAVLAEHRVEGFLEVKYHSQETSRTQYVGRGRPGKNRPKKTEWTVRYQITTVERIEPAIGHQVERLGWQVQVTNVPAQRLSLLESLQAYRGGWCGEISHPHYIRNNTLYQPGRSGYGECFGLAGIGPVVPQAA